MCFSIHGLPAGWTTEDIFKRYLFTIVSLLVIITSLFGYHTLWNYDEDPVSSEKRLAAEYRYITYACYAAAIVEVLAITKNVIYRASHGEWENRGSELPPYWRETIYDQLPESCGMAFFFAFVAVFWIWWPIKNLCLKNDEICETSTSKEETHQETDVTA